jgi:fused signal recognition particle receptor
MSFHPTPRSRGCRSRPRRRSAPLPSESRGARRPHPRRRRRRGRRASLPRERPRPRRPRRSRPRPPPSRPGAVGRLLAERHDPTALRQGLAKSREAGGFFGRLRALFAGKPEISAELTAQIEEVLISSDVGVATTDTLLARVRESISRGEALDDRQVWQLLREEAVRILEVGGTSGPSSCAPSRP